MQPGGASATAALRRRPAAKRRTSSTALRPAAATAAGPAAIATTRPASARRTGSPAPGPKAGAAARARPLWHSFALRLLRRERKGLQAGLHADLQAAGAQALSASSRAFLVLPARDGMWHRPHA